MNQSVPATVLVTNTTPAMRRYYRDLRALVDRHTANCAVFMAAQHLGGANASIQRGSTAVSAKPAPGNEITIIPGHR